VIIEIERRMDDVKLGIKREVDGMNDEIRKALHSQKEKMNMWVRLKIEEIVIRILNELRPSLKEAVKEPYMVFGDI
jgi:hypothetical protein